ncbi:MAG: beta-glucuronidase, partial [Muribaculaceae bacterium]|nr:beta-glucuronidase [Muribaculaceae bacterium]
LQTLCYKYEIELTLRTPDYTGFQLLALNAYSGQGTALEGVLNVFWKEKGYVDGRQWREFCSPVVPLAKFPKFVFTDIDSVSVPVEIINATGDNLGETKVSYTITDSEGRNVAVGIFGYTDISVGKNNQIGKVDLPIQKVSKPMKYDLSVSVGDKGRNSWEYWVYPEESVIEVPKNVFVTDTLDNNALSHLEKGFNVLLTAAGKVTLGKDIVQHYMPVFWNTSWFKMRPPHTTGAYINADHPLFAHSFPTDDWSNLNWWELLNKAQVMNLLELPAEYQSPIQPIDTWHLSRKLGMVVEANVLNGKLFMTTMDLDTDLDNRIVAKRMRNAILSYLSSEDFKPIITLQPEIITDFFTKKTAPVEMYTNETPDELKPKLK